MRITRGALHDGLQARKQVQQAGMGPRRVAQGDHPQLQAILQQVELIWLQRPLSCPGLPPQAVLS